MYKKNCILPYTVVKNNIVVKKKNIFCCKKSDNLTNIANFDLKPPLFLHFSVPWLARDLGFFLKTCKPFGLTLQKENTEFIVLIRCVVQS